MSQTSTTQQRTEYPHKVVRVEFIKGGDLKWEIAGQFPTRARAELAATRWQVSATDAGDLTVSYAVVWDMDSVCEPDTSPRSQS